MPILLHQQATLGSPRLHCSSTKSILIITKKPKSSFKALILRSPSLLSVSLKMSQDKMVPMTLCHNQTKQGFNGINSPNQYVPEKDLVSEALSKSTAITYSIKMRAGNKMTIKVWEGWGNNESFLDFVMQSGALIKLVKYLNNLDKAEKTLKEAKESIIKSRDLLRLPQPRTLSSKKPECHWQSTWQLSRKGDESKCWHQRSHDPSQSCQRGMCFSHWKTLWALWE